MVISKFATAVVALAAVAAASTAHAQLLNAHDPSTLLENKLHLIVRTKTKSELNTVIDHHDEIARERKECEEQLEAKKIPTACFEVLQKESSVGLLKSRGQGSGEKWLEQVCIRRANETKDLDALRLAAALRSLPAECQRTIEARKLDVEYTAEIENPVLLFRQRLPRSSETE